MRSVVILAIALFVLLSGGTGVALLWRRYERRQAAAILAGKGVANAASDPTGAIRELEIAFELDPRCEAASCEKIAEIRRVTGDNRGAVLASSRAIDLEPTRANALMTRGLARAELRDRDGAGDDFARVIALEPSRWQAHVLLGNVKSARGEPKEAVEHYTKAIELYPQDATAWRRRGRDRLRLGEQVGGRSDLDRAKALDPNDPALWVDLARLHAAKGHLSNELGALNQALLLDSKYAEALDYQAELRARLAAQGK